MSVAPGTRKLSEVARHVVKPSSITDSAWFDLDRTFVKLGITFDGWQDGAGQLILGLDLGGKYACTVGGACVSAPRQVGKTYLFGGLAFALAVHFPKLLIIWTAHHADTAAETFAAMLGMSQRVKIAPHVRKTFTSDNHKEIIFRNGSRILFGARARGFGRGIPGVDVLVCDEAQILPERAMDDMLATLNTSQNGLPIFLGTPPTPGDPSDAWRRMRADALSGESDDLVWIECGADPGAEPNDRDQWAKANPSFPHRTPVESMLRLQKKLTAEAWLREGLGIWDDADSLAEAWPDCRGERPGELRPAAVGLACEVEQAHSGIVAAGVSGDVAHVRSLQYGPGAAWVVDAAAAAARRWDVPVVVDGHGPAAPLIPDLEAAGVTVRVLTQDESCNAASEFARMVNERRMLHRGDGELDAAVKGAIKRPVGDRWMWGRRKSAGDVSPLEAATFAVYEALYPVGGLNVFTPNAPHRPTLVVGPCAGDWIRSQGGEPELHGSWAADAGLAEWVVAEHLAPWQRDRYRSLNAAKVVIVLDGYDDFRPSKYGKEETVTIGED